MSRYEKSIGKMTFEVTISEHRTATVPDGMLPLLTAAMKGEPLIIQIDGQDAFRAVPIGLDSEHGYQKVEHRATFKVEAAPDRPRSRAVPAETAPDMGDAL